MMLAQVRGAGHKFAAGHGLGAVHNIGVGDGVDAGSRRSWVRRGPWGRRRSRSRRGQWGGLSEALVSHPFRCHTGTSSHTLRIGCSGALLTIAARVKGGSARARPAVAPRIASARILRHRLRRVNGGVRAGPARQDGVGAPRVGEAHGGCRPHSGGGALRVAALRPPAGEVGAAAAGRQEAGEGGGRRGLGNVERQLSLAPARGRSKKSGWLRSKIRLSSVHSLARHRPRLRRDRPSLGRTPPSSARLCPGHAEFGPTSAEFGTTRCVGRIWVDRIWRISIECGPELANFGRFRPKLGRSGDKLIQICPRMGQQR